MRGNFHNKMGRFACSLLGLVSALRCTLYWCKVLLMLIFLFNSGFEFTHSVSPPCFARRSSVKTNSSKLWRGLGFSLWKWPKRILQRDSMQAQWGKTNPRVIFDHFCEKATYLDHYACRWCQWKKKKYLAILKSACSLIKKSIWFIHLFIFF